MNRAKNILSQALKFGIAVAYKQATGLAMPSNSNSTDTVPVHQMADKLKTFLAELVSEATPADGRIILFVDDLDRIPPVRAVQILESLKNFLDVKGLVTVLACDYKVISKGLEARVGVSEEALGRSFFDKIIQVPFRMPVHAYDANKFVCGLLARIKVKVPDERLEDVVAVLD